MLDVVGGVLLDIGYNCLMQMRVKLIIQRAKNKIKMGELSRSSRIKKFLRYRYYMVAGDNINSIFRFNIVLTFRVNNE